MRLRIVSDGTGLGTHVETEDGDRLENVTDIQWRVSANDEAARAVITFAAAVEVDVIGEDNL